MGSDKINDISSTRHGYIKPNTTNPLSSVNTPTQSISQPIQHELSNQLSNKLHPQRVTADILHPRSASQERLTSTNINRINKYLQQTYGLSIQDGEKGCNISDDQMIQLESLSLHDLNQLLQDINDYNQIIVGFNDFIEPLKSATNQIIDLKLTALTLKRHKSPEDKKIIIDAFCQRFAIDLKATVAEALEHLAIIFDKEPPPTLDDIAQAITDHRIYESFDYWAPVAYGNITDPFMDENIKHNFPDILTQKLYDQIPENVISKIEHSAERNHYSVKLNETNIPIPDDGVCFFSSCILAHVNARLEPISTVGAEEPSEEVPQDLKDHTLLSALPLDFSSDRLNDLKKSPYFGAINALIECGVSFNSVKNTNHQLNRFLVNIDETQFVDIITCDEFKDPYQAPDGLTYDRDALEKTIKAKLNPDEGTPMADLSPAQRIESIKIGSNFFDMDEAQRMADDMAEFDIDAKVEHIMSLMTPNHDVRFIIHYKQNFDLAKTIATELRLTLSDQEINQILVDYRDQLPGNSSNSPEAIRNIFNQH